MKLLNLSDTLKLILSATKSAKRAADILPVSEILCIFNFKVASYKPLKFLSITITPLKAAL
jgi:hypothetical protein